MPKEKERDSQPIPRPPYPPKYLREVYPLYHSLNLEQAIGKVFSDLNIAIPDDDLRLKAIIRQSYQQENRM
ncbi:MAG: hypothetical protein J6038_00815 [Bacilli bacterium]|nr:hypothetical protein [Bacilli bacterium]